MEPGLPCGGARAGRRARKGETTTRTSHGEGAFPTCRARSRTGRPCKYCRTVTLLRSDYVCELPSLGGLAPPSRRRQAAVNVVTEQKPAGAEREDVAREQVDAAQPASFRQQGCVLWALRTSPRPATPAGNVNRGSDRGIAPRPNATAPRRTWQRCRDPSCGLASVTLAAPDAPRWAERAHDRGRCKEGNVCQNRDRLDGQCSGGRVLHHSSPPPMAAVSVEAAEVRSSTTPVFFTAARSWYSPTSL